jgi:hypothetical protein
MVLLYQQYGWYTWLMLNNFAFLGTGTCDPNKGTKQLLAILGTAAAWALVVFLLAKLNKSNKPTLVKVSLSALLVVVVVVGSAVVFLAMWIGLACSR